MCAFDQFTPKREEDENMRHHSDLKDKKVNTIPDSRDSRKMSEAAYRDGNDKDISPIRLETR